MKIVIKNPAPKGPNLSRWGDFHFGSALADALAAQGVEATQHFWPDWELQEDEHATIWLRGKRRCTPRANTLNAIWILSHPATLTADELDAFDVIYAGSARLAEELDSMVSRPIEVLRQCTDTRIFSPRQKVPEDRRQGMLFVANSRGVRRPMLEWALAAGLEPSLIGQGWEELGMGHMVLSDFIENAELPALYARARYGMNDHWGDMAHYQIVNNRIFDSLACGLPLISDDFPELREVAGDAVRTVDGPRAFRDAYWELKLDYGAAVQACRQRWKKIGKDYSFDARARQILERLGALSAPAGPPGDPAPFENEVEWADRLLEQKGGLNPKQPRTTRNLLHICPARESSGVLAGTQKVSAVSAGFGPGPWNVRLDNALNDIQGRQFDVIYVEDIAEWKRSEHPDGMLHQLAGHVKLGGLISSSDGDILQPLLDDPRLATVSDSPLVLRRTVENLFDPGPAH